MKKEFEQKKMKNNSETDKLKEQKIEQKMNDFCFFSEIETEC